jgi:hypothetical protein
MKLKHAQPRECAQEIKRRRRHRSCQFIQQLLRLLQVRRIETLGEPIVDRDEQITGFHVLALVSRARLVESFALWRSATAMA